MSDRVFNTLFLCTHNSARSIMAECILNRLGKGRFHAFSAGSQPGGQVHPYALFQLRNHDYDTAQLRSKSWDEFAGLDAPHMDFVFTVCDNAANEVCPIWPGQPMSAHWGIPDPSSPEIKDLDRRFAFAEAYRMLYYRIGLFTSLPTASLERMVLENTGDRARLQEKLDQIGKSTPPAGQA